VSIDDYPQIHPLKKKKKKRRRRRRRGLSYENKWTQLCIKPILYDRV